VELKHPLQVYAPGAREEELGSLGEESYATPQSALAALIDGLEPGATVGVVPDGPYAFARADA